MARKGSIKQDQQYVDKMLLLLATVYESARLLPAGPLLQRCSLKHGKALLNFAWLKFSLSLLHTTSLLGCTELILDIQVPNVYFLL